MGTAEYFAPYVKVEEEEEEEDGVTKFTYESDCDCEWRRWCVPFCSPWDGWSLSEVTSPDEDVGFENSCRFVWGRTLYIEEEEEDVEDEDICRYPLSPPMVYPSRSLFACSFTSTDGSGRGERGEKVSRGGDRSICVTMGVSSQSMVCDSAVDDGGRVIWGDAGRVAEEVSWVW
jgi:hypothetical protein